MKINLTGHHVEITSAVREYIDQKLSKVASHYPTLISLDVILSKEHGEYGAEISTKYEGSRIAASGHDKVMYPAFAKASKKIDAALKHRKGQLKENLHEKPVSTSPDIAHEIIQDMKLS